MAQAARRAGAVNSSAVTRGTLEKPPHRIVRLFVNSSMMRRAESFPFALCSARFPLLRVRCPDSKYICIDAFRCQSVTRKTLLRYTLNSIPVNILISGNLWKKLSSKTLQSDLEL